MAADIFVIESRKTGQLYFRTGYGRIYHRHLHNDHSDAGAQTDGRNSRRRRISGAGRAHRRNCKNNESAFRYARCGFPCHIIDRKKKNSKISDGSGTDGSRSRTHKRAPVAGLGYSDTGSGRTGTSNMEFAGFLRSSVKRDGYDQFVRGSRYHGRNVAGRE